MDKKLLRFQNRRLAEKIEVRRRTETDLRNRIEQLENRLTTGLSVELYNIAVNSLTTLLFKIYTFSISNTFTVNT